VCSSDLIELELAEGTARETVEAMARQLLANTVIENFRIEMP
jgi:phosphoribosylformylglycinamidine synthase